MKIHIITIFPESFKSYFESSIIGKAKDKGLFELEFYKLNNFSINKSKRVDKKAYGMHGQVISAQPLSNAIEFIFERLEKKIPVLFMTPTGTLLNQEKVENYYQNLDEFILICGHYEGIDERIIELYDVEKISIGEYIISSGELASCVFIDSLVRHIPGVLGNELSLKEDSFSYKLSRQKEYPVYTRPEVFMGKKIPEVLISGNHGKIEEWKKNNLSN